MTDSKDIVERLRSNQPLVICPYDQKSPEYWTSPDDKPCKFCGGLPDGPDKCTGADTRIIGEAADEIERLRRALQSAKPYVDKAVKSAQQRGAVTMADILVPQIIALALSDSPLPADNGRAE